jgi:ribosomal protein L37AE/L43A
MTKLKSKDDKIDYACPICESRNLTRGFEGRIDCVDCGFSEMANLFDSRKWEGGSEAKPKDNTTCPACGGASVAELRGYFTCADCGRSGKREVFFANAPGEGATLENALMKKNKIHVCPECGGSNVNTVEGSNDLTCCDCDFTAGEGSFDSEYITRRKAVGNNDASPLASALQKAAIAHRSLAAQHRDCRVTMSFTPAGVLIIGSRAVGGFGGDTIAETRFELTWAQIDGEGNHACENAVGLVFSALLAYGLSDNLI